MVRDLLMRGAVALVEFGCALILVGLITLLM
jgi:hypothetical protein